MCGVSTISFWMFVYMSVCHDKAAIHIYSELTKHWDGHVQVSSLLSSWAGMKKWETQNTKKTTFLDIIPPYFSHYKLKKNVCDNTMVHDRVFYWRNLHINKQFLPTVLCSGCVGVHAAACGRNPCLCLPWGGFSNTDQGATGWHSKVL